MSVFDDRECQVPVIPHTVRWMTAWAEELEASENVAFTRGPEVPLTASGDAEVLWPSWTDLASEDRIARRLADVGVVLAGREWEEYGEALGGVFNGIVHGDAGEPVEVYMPDGIPFVVLASRDDQGQVDALRMIGDTDAFDGGEWPMPIGIIEVSEHVTVTGGDVTDVFEVRPGTYVVQTGEEPCAVQMYRIPAAQAWSREPLERCPVCDEGVIPTLWGLPSEEMFELAEAGLITLGGCVIDGSVGPERCIRCSSWFVRAEDDNPVVVPWDTSERQVRAMGIT